jgi:E3 ubiquitin-protein ligase ZNF598
MATSNDAVVQMTEGSAPTHQRLDGHNTGRGRGRGRGGRVNTEGPDTARREGFGGRRGRAGQRGGGNRNVMSASDLPARFGQTSAANDPKTQIQHSTAPVQSSAIASNENEVEAEVCFICASPVVHNSVAPCNHRTCHICALRMRALYKTKDCAHCRVSSQLYFNVSFSLGDANILHRQKRNMSSLQMIQ